jgi:signal transduction histidine kinase
MGWIQEFKRRSGTVRVRTTVAAVLVVGAALVAASIAMVLLLRKSLTQDVRTTALLRADTVAELISDEDEVEPIRISNLEDEFVQVLSGDEVVASSENVAGHPALVVLEPGASRRIDVPFEDDPFLAVARSAPTPDETFTVVVGRTIETAEESSRVVITLLIAGLPILLLIVAAVTWKVVGRALAPVESIRSEVESISTGELHRRVPGSEGGDEIARLAGTMNEMLARLEKGQARQRRFVSDASHEFRSPVASIRQHAEVALRHPDGASTQELARAVLDEDLRLQRLVEDMLLLARVDENGSDSRKESVDLDDLVFEEVDRVRNGIGKTIDTKRVSAGRVLGDRRQLSRLVGNLLENAVRHARSSVAVGLREDGSHVQLDVDDDGTGVPPAERARIFERFVRLEEARDRDSGGSGLGLAIVAEVTAIHGGTARVSGSKLGGARFTIRFPGQPD